MGKGCEFNINIKCNVKHWLSRIQKKKIQEKYLIYDIFSYTLYIHIVYILLMIFLVGQYNLFTLFFSFFMGFLITHT